MANEKFFTNPTHDWQRRYEALRASFVERLPARVVADRYGYSPGYVHLLRHHFRHGKIDFSEPVPEGSKRRRKVDAATRKRIRLCREKHLSAGQIAELLSEEGIELSVRTVERVLREEGFEKLPRRTGLQIGMTVRGTEVPESSHVVTIDDREGEEFPSDAAGIFLFAPFLAQLGVDKILHAAKLPGTKTLPAMNYFLSFLALKLMGTERFAHAGDHGFDPGLGLFAGLNVLPKCTSMSSYGYGLDAKQIDRLELAFVKQAKRLGLYDEGPVNLDFHTVPHFGDESVLEKHWAGARNKKMKGALTLFAQNAGSKLMLYTQADIQRNEADDEVLEFLSFWKKAYRGVQPTLIFDSRFTTYGNLAKLDGEDVTFITLRRRGSKLIEKAGQITDWKRIHIPHAKRKYQYPLVHESIIELKGYKGPLRQVIMKGTGREKPTFLITNDLTSPVEMAVGDYARRWRVENGIAEAVKFFHLNALSSPILVKAHFDVAMTLIADTLYTMLAGKLRGHEHCDAPKLFRDFVKGRGTVAVKNGVVSVRYPRRAHNPILRKVAWNRLPMVVPGLDDVPLAFTFA